MRNYKKNNLVLPIVKWVGGKRQLLEDISSVLPQSFNTYFEPFLGGGAVLFDVLEKYDIKESQEKSAPYYCNRRWCDGYIWSIQHGALR